MKPNSEKILVWRNDKEIKMQINAAKSSLKSIQILLDECKKIDLPVDSEVLNELLEDAENYAKRHFVSLVQESDLVGSGGKKMRREAYIKNHEVVPDLSGVILSSDTARDALRRTAAPHSAFQINNYRVSVSPEWESSTTDSMSYYAVTDREKEILKYYQGLVEAVTGFNKMMKEHFGYIRPAIDPPAHNGAIANYITYGTDGNLQISIVIWLDLVKRFPR